MSYGTWGSEWPPEVYYRLIRQRGQGSGGTPPFTPSVVNPRAWYDPSDLSTMFQDGAGTIPVTANNDPVARVNDKSGNSPPLLAAIDAARPLYKTAGGLHWLEFDGVDDTLSASYDLTQPWDRISAHRWLGASDPERFFGGSTTDNGQLYTTVGELRIYSGVELSGLAAPAQGVDFVATERHDGVNSRLAIDKGAYQVGNAGANASVGIRLAKTSGSSDFANFRFYVLVEKAAFTDDEVALLQTYSAAKQGRLL